MSISVASAMAIRRMVARLDGGDVLIKNVQSLTPLHAKSTTAIKRECGSCTLCCKVVGVKALDKPQDRWCQHCTIGVGCQIYDKSERPQECGVFECLWLQGLVPEALRPDKTHVVLGATLDGERTQAWVDKHYPDAYRKGKMGQYLQQLVNKKIDVIVILGESRVALTQQLFLPFSKTL